MTHKDISIFKKWFSDYVKSFYSLNKIDNKNILIKEEHTGYVVKNAVLIAKVLCLDENNMLLTEAAALFHDIGRFKQYALYKTYADRDSVNHAVLGTALLAGEKVLNRLSEYEEGLILETVKLHNVFKMPQVSNKDTKTILKIVRDADKLDIWRVFSEYYLTSVENRPSAVSLGVPDIPEYSDKIIRTILNRQMAYLNDVKTLNDFKLLQLSWIYDINFPVSLSLVAEKRYIVKIVDTLPKTDDIRDAVGHIQEYLVEKTAKL